MIKQFVPVFFNHNAQSACFEFLLTIRENKHSLTCRLVVKSVGCKQLWLQLMRNLFIIFLSRSTTTNTHIYYPNSFHKTCHRVSRWLRYETHSCLNIEVNLTSAWRVELTHLHRPICPSWLSDQGIFHPVRFRLHVQRGSTELKKMQHKHFWLFSIAASSQFWRIQKETGAGTSRYEYRSCQLNVKVGVNPHHITLGVWCVQSHLLIPWGPFSAAVLTPDSS